MAGLAVSALLVAVLAVVVAAALAMSWSQRPDPKLVFLAGLMRKAPRQAAGTRRPSFLSHHEKCPH